jgi:tRNA threonylcarbamoyladenosine biosynthesis protein TsaE
MIESVLQLRLSDTEATDILGSALARSLPSVALSPAVCYLRGDLGAGKTTCARSLLRTLGVTGIVRSPTYTLIETYAVGAVECVHVDLYRLRDPLDLEDLGLRDYWTPQHVVLIEWPERGGDALGAADLELDLSYAEAGRDASVRAASPFGESWLVQLRNDTRITRYLSNLT